ncbi:thiaminase II [Nesterenkonia populi]|uniref:thiaminase II n=1 Tax=Nesterenkonia populi TaxID=1591087 RepID=UPI0011BDC859|nr:thiaminase II [Nesterenkonia populi]
MSTLFDRLKSAASEEWVSYTDHAFIQQMEAGTLPPAAFREYLIQDYHFLVHFARAYALIGYKARSLEDLRYAQEGIGNILHETSQHVKRLGELYGLTPEDIEDTPEDPANIAYTRFVLDAGATGDLLDLHVALSPCVIGYAEIGQRLKPAVDGDPEHPYAEWISEYSSDWYQETARSAVEHIDALAARGGSDARFGEIVKTFTTATRAEAAFWQMGLDRAENA